MESNDSPEIPDRGRHQTSPASIKGLQRTRIQNMQFAVYISDISVTLKQSHGHQTYNDNVDPKQGYNRAKFERSAVMMSMKKSQH